MSDRRPGIINYFGLQIEPQGSARESRTWYAEVTSAVDDVEFALAGQLLQSHDRVIVAGAGYGSVAVRAAAICGVESVVAFEANWELARLVAHNVRISGQPLNIMAAALTAEDDPSGVLFYTSKHWPQSSLKPQHIPAENALGSDRVACFGVNKAIEMHRATALLLDVEGAEYDILQALDFSPLRLLIVEIHGTEADVENSRLWIEQCGLAIVRKERVSERLHVIGAIRIPDWVNEG